MRAALLVSWLAFRCRGQLPRAALRRRRPSRGQSQSAGEGQSLSGRGMRRLALGLSRAEAGAMPAALGILRMEERLPPDRPQRARLQLAAMPGEFDRSG